MGIKIRVVFEGKKDDENVHVSARFEDLDSDEFKNWIEKIKPLQKEKKGDYCRIKGFTKNL